MKGLPPRFVRSQGGFSESGPDLRRVLSLLSLRAWSLPAIIPSRNGKCSAAGNRRARITERRLSEWTY
jgi:hypothetical protein